MEVVADSGKLKIMIRLVVVSVSRRASAEIRTFSLTPSGEQKASPRQGSEWEEVELAVENEEKPTIMVGNIVGNAFIANRVVKLIINSPDLFGKYKVGDVVPLIPETKVELKEVKS